MRESIILSLTLASALKVLAAGVNELEEHIWNDQKNKWNEPSVDLSCDSYTFVTVTRTWTPPDLMALAYPDEFVPGRTAVYNTEEEAEMAIERMGGKKKKFRRRKKHLKNKKYLYKIKPQAYLLDDAYDRYDVLESMSYANSESVQSVAEQGSATRASPSAVHTDRSKSQVALATTPSSTGISPMIQMTLSPKVLLSEKGAASSASMFSVNIILSALLSSVFATSWLAHQ